MYACKEQSDQTRRNMLGLHKVHLRNDSCSLEDSVNTIHHSVQIGAQTWLLVLLVKEI